MSLTIAGSSFTQLGLEHDAHKQDAHTQTPLTPSNAGGSTQQAASTGQTSSQLSGHGYSDRQARNQKPLPTPTTGEATLQLASTGQTAAEIAANLGEPISEVDSTLGITTASSSTQTGAIAALTARLSVRA